MVKGQQTFDQALNEWVEGTISVSADIEVSLPPGTVKTFVGTNKLALVRTDLNQAMKSRP